MPKRKILLENLARIGALPSKADKRIGILVPSFADAKQFRSDLLKLIEELPVWVISNKVVRCNSRKIEFDNKVEIHFFYDANGSKGMSIDDLWVSSRVTDEQITPHCFSVINHGFARFDDEGI